MDLSLLSRILLDIDMYMDAALHNIDDILQRRCAAMLNVPANGSANLAQAKALAQSHFCCSHPAQPARGSASRGNLKLVLLYIYMFSAAAGAQVLSDMKQIQEAT